MNYTNHYKISGFFFIYGLLNLYSKKPEYSTLFGYSALFVGFIAVFLGIYSKSKEHRSIIKRYNESKEATSNSKKIETAIINKLVYIPIFPDVAFYLLKVRKENGKKGNLFMIADEHNIKLVQERKLLGKLDFLIYKDIVTCVKLK